MAFYFYFHQILAPLVKHAKIHGPAPLGELAMDLRPAIGDSP
jgi:hypothetical protein